ncbi:MULTISPECIES: gas vesicle protein GvpG [unclassified Streptomyces]|uniref:Gas vesicle protein GvpG n=1 Tax=Streptomyces millisiae TaxID=3075542 RepID=A0ABU2LSF3_9ACTN|nr:gas vesicle protein GvpG [Streptomyces sp. DSM 44918]MDT0320527.1 gas vesicle protein GvpG [Streptomyces sp. DSM 44918]
MGLLSGLLLLPLAPVRGVRWLTDQVAEAAEKEYYDPAPLMARLAALHRALDEGEIDQAEFEREEEPILHRIQRLQTADEGWHTRHAGGRR